MWFDEAGRHMESLESERPVGEQLLSQFYRAVTSLVRKSSGLEDSCVALATVMAAQASAEKRREAATGVLNTPRWLVVRHPDNV